MRMNSLLFLLSLLGAIAAQTLSSDGQQHPQVRDVHGSEETRRWMGDLNSVLAGMSSGRNTKTLVNDVEDDFYPDWINNNLVRHFAPKVNCDPILNTCLTFLNDFSKTIVTRNSTEMRKYFSESFRFTGCRDLHFLDDVVTKLAKVPLETGVFAILNSQRNYRNDHIQLNVTVHGAFTRPFSAEFVLSKKTATLLEGRDTECLNL